MIFAEVARGLDGRDVNKTYQVPSTSCCKGKSPPDTPEIPTVIPREYQI